MVIGCSLIPHPYRNKSPAVRNPARIQILTSGQLSQLADSVRPNWQAIFFRLVKIFPLQIHKIQFRTHRQSIKSEYYSKILNPFQICKNLQLHSIYQNLTNTVLKHLEKSLSIERILMQVDASNKRIWIKIKLRFSNSVRS